MEETPQGKTGIERAVQTAQLIILTYSTAMAVQGIYKMSNQGATILMNHHKTWREAHPKKTKRRRKVDRKHLDVIQ